MMTKEEEKEKEKEERKRELRIRCAVDRSNVLILRALKQREKKEKRSQ